MIARVFFNSHCKMAVNISSTDLLNNIMNTQLDLEELKINIENMFLVINGIIVTRE